MFLGWCDENEQKYAVSNGTMTKSWDKVEANTTLYAQWELVEYSITYSLGGGINASDNPSNYNIETNDIILSPATREGYRFIGWRDNNGQTITTIPKGSYRNITLTAVWEIEYSITFTANNISCDDSTYNGNITTIKAINGEEIKLFDTGLGGLILKSDTEYFEQGSEYVVVGNRTFELVDKNRDQLYDSTTGYYEIWTYSQLNTIVRSNLSSNYKMMVNIIQPENTTWTPMETYKGTFDGNNHWIRNLRMTYGLTGSSQTVSSNSFGLFKTNNGTIKNLGISKGSFGFYQDSATYQSTPLYCGYIAGVNNGTIENCQSVGSYTQFAYISTYIDAYVGVICGQNNGTVKGSFVFETAVQITTGCGGGIVGYNNGGSIEDCEIGLSHLYCYQEFSTDTSEYYYEGHSAAVGGIVGYTRGGEITNCVVQSGVEICYNGSYSDSKTLAPEMGNIAGRSSNNASIIGNTSSNVTDSDKLQVVTWTEGWWIFEQTYTWDQTQFVGGDVGRYV